MEYIIVRTEWPSSTAILVKKVQERINEGFIPVGGMSTWNDRIKGRIHAQAMIRHKPVQSK